MAAIDGFHLFANTLRLRQNGQHFTDDILKWIFLNENVWISIEISLKFVSWGLISNTPALVQIMAWCWPCDKPLSERMMVSLPVSFYLNRFNTGLYNSFQCLLFPSPHLTPARAVHPLMPCWPWYNVIWMYNTFANYCFPWGQCIQSYLLYFVLCAQEMRIHCPFVISYIMIPLCSYHDNSS